jgi:hypothetical protein
MIDGGTGREVADYLAEQAPSCPIIIYSTNSNATLAMEVVLQEAKWKTKSVVPWGDLESIPSLWFPDDSQSHC